MSLTVFVTTIGRKSLPICVKSFTAQAEAGDKMIVFGDGWDEPWAHSLGVEFKAMPKRGNWGYDHVFDALPALDTDYWQFIGDDDAFMPGARPELSGPIVSTGAFLAFPDGRNFYYPPYGPKKNFSGNWQTFYHRNIEISRLYDDAEIFIRAAAEYEVHSIDTPILQIKFPNLSKTMWDTLEFNKIAPWSPEMASWLTDESGCFKVL